MCKKSYYVAVHDKTFWWANWDTENETTVVTPCKEDWVPRINEVRQFTNQFESTVVKALSRAIHDFLKYDQFAEKSDATALTYEDVMDRIEYDEETQCYYFYEFITTGVGLHPKEIHWDKYYEGEYTFIAIRHEFQILKTTISTANSEKVLEELKDIE